MNLFPIASKTALVLASFTGFLSPAFSQEETADPSAGSVSAAALQSIFSPSRAPSQKTMGLLQRSFLDLAEQDDSLLQVAIVIDGTDSMATELSGVQKSVLAMVDDLRLTRGDKVEIAMVVYRDSRSPSGEVSIPLKTFSRDTDAIADAVGKIVAEPGAPYFHELVDVGVYAAINELPWSSDPSANRWIMLFGDAPPYDIAFSDPKNPGAKRRYRTELLVELAKRESIRIHCVLCTSDIAAIEPFDKAKEQTRSFMEQLASDTSGLMLDLSYPDIKQAIIDADRIPKVQYVAIRPITRQDINTMSLSPQAKPNKEPTVAPEIAGEKLVISEPAEQNSATNPNREVRIAILPHLPLDQMSFDPSDPAVQISTALRNQFKSIPGMRVTSPIEVRQKLRQLSTSNLSDEQRLRALAAMLSVDYVVWGSKQSTSATIQTAAYRREDGTRCVTVSLPGNNDSMAKVLLTAASSSPDEQVGALGGLLKRIDQLGAATAIDLPLAANEVARNELLAAMECLDQAMGLPAGDAESLTLLQQSLKGIELAAKSDPRNPIVSWLRSNVAYNLAAQAFKTSDESEGNRLTQQMKDSLNRAYADRGRIKAKSLATEVEADYSLLVRRDVEAAVTGYTAMTDMSQPSATRLRGHWMLSGIYAGDWGVDESKVNQEAAREHLVSILANWPESPEAELLCKWMRWDDASGKTKFSYLPITNRQIAKMK